MISVVLCLSMVLLVGTVSFGQVLDDSYQDYSVGTSYVAIHTYQCKKSGAVLNLNTRPTSGTSGVKVWTAGSNGKNYKETFPYQTSRGAMTVNLKKSVSYLTHVASVAGKASGKMHSWVTI